MPYFVFKLSADNKQAEHLETFEEFGKAKQLCRELREQSKPGESSDVRMVFAKTKKEAKSLITTPRKPSTPLEEWEG